MKNGDVVKATWYDGLVLTGIYSKMEQGYVILIDEGGKKIVCNPHCVEFEVINESR
tara:strand:+ start:1037 stop:1204 length:168 start_codon:yes stop_codon:yes gene_type:complete